MQQQHSIRLPAQEAAKFMRHSKRTVLSGEDVFLALRAKNVQVGSFWVQPLQRCDLTVKQPFGFAV